MEPTFDEHGYPTRKTLRAIKSWSYDNIAGFFDYVEKALSAYGTFQRHDDLVKSIQKIYIATGGWSGNESVIEAMQKNIVIWAMTWESSHRGGGYWFHVPIKKDAQDE
jgi:hypothetical protein